MWINLNCMTQRGKEQQFGFSYIYANKKIGRWAVINHGKKQTVCDSNVTIERFRITFRTNVPLRLTNSQIKENADKKTAKICFE